MPVADLYSNQEVSPCLPVSVCVLCSVNQTTFEQEIGEKKRDLMDDSH